ncbi:MAG: hypothetical protein ITG04_12250 [Proteiniphilum sp.]|nr:hypothetical protein [Proteiniphilum sp.]
MRRQHLLTLILLFSSFSIMAQENDSISYPGITFDGTLKNKLEYATETGMSRFSVRNSRIGAKGIVNPYTSFRVQIELSDNGDFKVLDLSGTLKPLDGLTFTLGQTGIPLFNSYIVTPGTMMFANRAFLGKYFLSTRDLGILAKYEFNMGMIPTKLEAGLFNGNAINDPVWKKKKSFGARVELGSMEGARVTAKLYDYPRNENQHFLFYGADFRYQADRWKVETEIMKRESQTELYSDMLSYYLQGAYSFPIKSKLFDYLLPAVRWDGIDERLDESGFDVNRLTTGIGLGFDQKKFASIVRIDYEWYFINNEMIVFAGEPEMDSDKFTVELLITF